MTNWSFWLALGTVIIGTCDLPAYAADRCLLKCPVGTSTDVCPGATFTNRRGLGGDIGHTGVDLANGHEGPPVFAMADGVVTYAQSLDEHYCSKSKPREACDPQDPDACASPQGNTCDPAGWGHMIRIKHEFGPDNVWYSQYGHCKIGSLMVKKGDRVIAGNKLCEIDCTGNTQGITRCESNGGTGAHVHVEWKPYDRNGCGYLPNPGCPNDKPSDFRDPLVLIKTDKDHDGAPEICDCDDNDAGKLGGAVGSCGADSNDSDADGVVDAKDLCPGTPPGRLIDNSGCACSQNGCAGTQCALEADCRRDTTLSLASSIATMPARRLADKGIPFGQDIQASFELRNASGVDLVVDELVLGCRLNGQSDCRNYRPSTGDDVCRMHPCPDFTAAVSGPVSLSAGATYHYQGTFRPAQTGYYKCEVFYRTGSNPCTGWRWNLASDVGVNFVDFNIDPCEECGWDRLCSVQGPPLRSIAGSCGRRIGSAVQFAPLASGVSWYRDRLGEEFNQLTPENELKWGSLRPSRTEYKFLEADTIVQYAEAHQMFVRGHALVWPKYVPCWLQDGGLSASDQEMLLREHIDTVVGRYKGHIDTWDVVNEAFDEQGDYLAVVGKADRATAATNEKNIWYNPGVGSAGPAYIEKAFQFAHAADDTAKLFYNDFDLEKGGPKFESVRALVADLVGRNVPIHGVGFQMHVDLCDYYNCADKPNPSSPPDLSQFASNVNSILSIDPRLEVQITELDVRVPVPSDEVIEEAQVAVFGAIVATCASIPRCRAVQMWGYTDRHSWVPYFPNLFPGKGDALPFDACYQPKAAFGAIREALSMGCGASGSAPIVASETATDIFTVDDFNDGNFVNTWGGVWKTDGAAGHSLAATIVVGPGGGNAIHVAGGFDGYGLLQSSLREDFGFDDALSGWDAIQFDVKGDDRPYWFQIHTGGVADGDHFGHVFWASRSWRTVTIRISDLQQQGFHVETPGTFLQSSAVALQWMNFGAREPQTIDLTVDNVKLLKYAVNRGQPWRNVQTKVPAHCYP